MRASEESHYEGTEPVRGLPARLPPGEFILWQGEPGWWALAVRMFHFRKLAIYFAVLLSYDAALMITRGDGVNDAMASIGELAVLAIVALGVIALFSFAVSRTTVYTMTNRRVVIRAGIAVSKTVNIPFVRVAEVGLKAHGNGNTGDIMLTPMADDRIAYLVLWPHVRAWKLSHARPVLRAVPNAARVADLLGQTLAADGQAAAGAERQRASSRQHAVVAA